MGKDPVKEVYVGSSTVWYEKGTGRRAGTHKEYEIVQVVEYHRQQVLSHA